MQLKLFAIHLPIGVMIVSLILFSQILTAAAAGAEEQTDIELENEDTKEQLGASETTRNDDNMGKQEEEATEEQESNDDTRERESQDNVMIDDDDDHDHNINSSEVDDVDDDTPFELPFDDIIPFP
jgi:hypothetical protein